MKEWSPKFNLNRQRLTNYRSNLIHSLFSNRKEPPSIVNCCLQNLLNLKYNQFFSGLWSRRYLATNSIGSSGFSFASSASASNNSGINCWSKYAFMGNCLISTDSCPAISCADLPSIQIKFLLETCSKTNGSYHRSFLLHDISVNSWNHKQYRIATA